MSFNSNCRWSKALNYRYNIIQPITAGWDSRILLAASKEVMQNISYYVFTMDEKKTTQDSVIPQKLSELLSFSFKQITPPILSKIFIEKYSKEAVIPRILYKTRFIEYHKKNRYPQNTVNINGNGLEIARCYYGNSNNKVTIDMLMTFCGYQKEQKLIKKNLNKWLINAQDFALNNKINIFDLFYWEQRMGNWGAQFPFEQDIAIEEISPFNNREIISTLLSIKGSKRCLPKYKTYNDLIATLWKECLSVPINPDDSYISGLIHSNTILWFFLIKTKRFLKKILSFA